MNNNEPVQKKTNNGPKPTRLTVDSNAMEITRLISYMNTQLIPRIKLLEDIVFKLESKVDTLDTSVPTFDPYGFEEEKEEEDSESGQTS